ncbi:MAG TPA: serine/threonine-protein kinase [Kofleriaceae bacterium]
MNAAIPSAIDLADALLHAALRAEADRVWIEPLALGDAVYTIAIERKGKVLATTTLDAVLAQAMLARLAVIGDVDPTSTGSSTGSTRIRKGDSACELVVMLRPGPRAELMFVPETRSGRGFEDLRPGDCVDHYRVVEHKGAGGMGCVYEVDHVTLGRRYALKVLHGDVLERDPRSIDRFVREARAASRIHHPNIVDVFDFGYLPDGRPYFVMELLDGTSLGDLVDNDGAIEPVRAIAIARELVDALRAAHESGVIHADVTPSNVLVDGDHVKLVDFGLAELLADVEIDEHATHIMGTPRYVAPERLQGRLASEACDQYSLGIVLFEMIAGVTPFHHPDIRALCKQHIHEPLPALVSPFMPVPEELERLIARCCAKSPSQRFPTMRALAAELEAVAWIIQQGARRAAS